MGDWPKVEAKAAAPQIGLRAMGAGDDTINATTVARHRCDEGDDPLTETTALRHCGDKGNDPTTATTALRHCVDDGDDPTTPTTTARHGGDEGNDPTTANSALRHCVDDGDDPTTPTTTARHCRDEGDDPTTATTALSHCVDDDDDPTTPTTTAHHRGDEGDEPTKATMVSCHRGEDGDDPMTAKAAASQNLGEHGESGSDATFLAYMLISMKNHVSFLPSSREIPVNDLVLPDDERQPQANKTGHCASYISLNVIPDDHRHDVIDDSAHAVKSGFKGKRATKKFSRNGKRGGDRKIIPRDRQGLSPGPHPSETHPAPPAGRKITKTQIIKKFGYVSRQCRQAQSKMDAALKDNHRLKKKASKTNEVVDELRTNLKCARIDVRHCKSVITELKDNHRSSTNATEKKHEHMLKSVITELKDNHRSSTNATEKKHEHMLNTMRNVANETMKASNDLHASQLKRKDNDIMVIQSCVGTQLESKDNEILVSQSCVVMDTV
jgi:hypothetical protein